MEQIKNLLMNPQFLLGFSANFFYIYAIWKSRKNQEPMKPVRISWFIFFMLDLLIMTNEILNGKTISELGLHIGYLLGAFLVFLVSIPYGEWLEKSDSTNTKKIRDEYKILAMVAIAALVYLFGGEKYSIYFLGIALIIGAYPTIKKIWDKPQSEAGFPWLMWLVAASLGVYNLGTITDWEITKAFIPCVYLGLNIPIAWAIGNRK